ncbi:ABC transporter substrate-binding protein [Halomonas sp. ML-15]|uniref:ABC transporter substrate-binding protein n=1 Tax=Halomonas sp. ML-15 TaxID=2773305 RepID=UPI001CD10CF0|nr:ABC transporter substrate-binding protein [Halomonas sp. ML-15]
MPILRYHWMAATMLAVPLALGSLAAHAESSLVMAIGGEPDDGFDPLLGWGHYGHPLFQSTLLSRDADLATQPELARDWTLSDDRLRWTISLRDDAYFSDGTALTAADVAFTFNAASRAGGRADLSVLANAEALDERRVKLTLKEPRVTFMDTFYTLGIVPAAQRDNGYHDGYGRAPLGSGPYQLVEWQEGEQLIVERNPHFYGETPPFERLVFQFTGEDTTLAAANAGRLHLASVPPALAAQPPSGMQRVAMQSVDNRGMLFPMQPDRGETSDSDAPIGNDVTADPAIRQAINLAVDRELLVEVALHGFGQPAFGPADGLAWTDPAERFDDADLETAAALLDAAGWQMESEGLRQRDGQAARFRLTYPAGDTTRQLLAESVAEMLRPLGIAVDPTGRHWDEIRREALHQDAILFGWGSHSPQEIYYLYHSQYAGQDYYNSGFYANPAVDAHLEVAQAAESLEASLPHWRAAQWDGTTGYGMRGDAAWAWLVNLEHLYFVDDCLDMGELGIAPHGHGWPITANLLEWQWQCD